MATIDIRTYPSGKKTYRVRTRLKGHRPVCATFPRKTELS